MPLLSFADTRPIHWQDSYLCETCADGSFPPGDGSCTGCPVVTGVWQRYRGLIALLAGVVAIAVVVYLCILVLVRIVGGAVSASAQHVVALIAWSLQAIQIVSQVTRASSTSLPAIMRAVYAGVALLQLEGILLPPQCTGAYPFETEVSSGGNGNEF